MARRRQKSMNGEGFSNSITISFDRTDPDEARAMDYARHIARPHGRRKKLMVLLLNMLADIEEATGRPLTAEGLGGKLSAMLFLGESPRNIPQEFVEQVPRVQVSTAKKVSNTEVAQNLAARLSNRMKR